MYEMLRCAGLGAALLASVLQARSDPLTELLAASNGTVCYDRVYDTEQLPKNTRQRTRAIRLALKDYPQTGGATLRVAITETSRTRYMLGECYWDDEANLDIMGEPILESFGHGPGLNCHVSTTVSGTSAQEGGGFPVDLREGRSIVVHLPEYLAAWQSLDNVSGPAKFFKLGPDDRMFRLNRADAALCAELNEKLPWWQ